MVWERLDRAVCTAKWYDLFPATCVQTLTCVSSDHSPICIRLGGFEAKRSRPWHFEQMWLEDSGCRDTVVRTWDRSVSGSPMEVVVSKLGACQKSLLQWSKNSFCHVRREIAEKKKLLKVAEGEAAQGRQVDQFQKLKSDIVDLLRLDEKMWQQRSKEHWMISGDRNSKFFHTRASQRFHRNRIVELRNSEGVLVSGEGNISTMVRDYYKNLFLSSGLSEVDEVVRTIKSVVTEDMNNSLISPFSRVEVEVALNQMAPLKAPGPDGMPPIFFQKFWSDIGDDVVQAVLFCLSSGCLLSASPKKWSPPAYEVWKINFDGALFGESADAGVGVVVQNSRGEVRAALTEKIMKPHSVEVLELLAARRAALFSQELGLDRVIFEGDSEQVIKALQWGGWDFASGGHFIRDILCIVNSFMSTSFSHVCRQGNAVAHALAQRARHCFPISIWLESYPTDISSFVLADIQHLLY
ncbi:hypothetical protein SO802_006223 [Lithocarpus litseifolius]|uniref:RNase H type-1 domain-containing protein n=1 Tax=Lithocarpus litseifolius TaxID=425828 RepID=A0AAW2DKA7_9ROSI